jgi:hypothetical protein
MADIVRIALYQNGTVLREQRKCSVWCHALDRSQAFVEFAREMVERVKRM